MLEYCKSGSVLGTVRGHGGPQEINVLGGFIGVTKILHIISYIFDLLC